MLKFHSNTSGGGRHTEGARVPSTAEENGAAIGLPHQMWKMINGKVCWSLVGIVLGQKSSLAMQPIAQQRPLLNHGTASYLNKKRSIPEGSRKERMARVVRHLPPR